MPLDAGRTVGPYRVIAALGAGGMGEVYRARDTRLGREVALKVLPLSDRSDDPDRRRRFEREARAVAALNHPNILAIHDLGSAHGLSYVVFELLEGQTLRTRLERGAVPVRKVVDYGLQICRGLAAAHERGILHRDLKPENLFLTGTGQVKILDFGLATATGPEGTTAASTGTATGAGVMLGTVGYMAPEQVRGQRADARSDVFALGAVLYEMVSGRRAFEGKTAADTLSAILNRDPPEITPVEEGLPPAVPRVIRRCLEKEPDERFQSARDMGFALDALSAAAEAAFPPASPRPRRARALRLGAAAALALIAVAAGYFWGTRQARPLPSFKQLTFRQGAVLDDARFTADGNTVVYSGLWDGNPPEIFTTRLDSPLSRSLGLPPARLLCVSSRGELAILIARPGDASGHGQGTLARVPLSGGTPREVLGDVQRADWSPDGSELAVVRLVEGEWQLEYPVGRVLRRPVSYLDGGLVLRVSPQGDRVALASDEGLLVIDRAGKAKALRVPDFVLGVVWTARGDALWAAAGPWGPESTLWYVPLEGEAREVARFPGHPFLHDLSRDGRFLMHIGAERTGVRARPSGASAEIDLTAYQHSKPVALSADGNRLLLGDFSPSVYGSYLRPTRGGPLVRLTEGWPLALSPDGRWLLHLHGEPRQLVLTPTVAGESRSMPAGSLIGMDSAWFVDAGRLVLNAGRPGESRSAFLLDMQAGSLVPITPEGTLAVPDSLVRGEILAYAADGALARYPLAGGPPRPLGARVPKGTVPVRESADRRSLFLGEVGVPGHLDRFEVATGRRIPWKTLRLEDSAGLYLVDEFKVTSDGEAYAYRYRRHLQDLYLVEGVR